VPEEFRRTAVWAALRPAVVRGRSAANLMPRRFLPTSVLAACAFVARRRCEQKIEHWPGIVMVFARRPRHRRRGKNRPLMTKMQAGVRGNGFTLVGDKAFVVDGQTAGPYDLAARRRAPPGEREGADAVLGDPQSQKASRSSARAWSIAQRARISSVGNVERSTATVRARRGAIRAASSGGRAQCRPWRGPSEMVGYRRGGWWGTGRLLKDASNSARPRANSSAAANRARADLHRKIEITRARCSRHCRAGFRFRKGERGG